MAEWAPKRFWKEAAVADLPEGFAVRLDGRPVRTPGKAPLSVPTRALAHAIAAEWDAQAERVEPETMPYTRAANAAIDKVTPRFDDVARMLADYADADLLCYRAESPEALVARQAAGWDPLLDWADKALGARLVPVSGVMHVPQPGESLRALGKRVFALTPFELTALHDMVTISGSLVIGLAAIQGHREIADLWEVSRIDEVWQEEAWGIDEEAMERTENRRKAFHHAANFHAMLQRRV
ncbi:ATPase [Defluviimonas sp. 20V17]|uniref:ATPase n=1 Tax=Allgaiera indica TaxID=765699 RepID=A0AAN4UUN5_9RHOB|nr:ATP12 family protein [Allgaiera indica]KDB04835.1 ATPase [Defluviimonas sp. 20V17]GHE05779.1 ATPase [Allgaiera indica]SDX79427.1 Chaperone required for the assembly of the F1-ATPase [Allgaiera indica]